MDDKVEVQFDETTGTAFVFLRSGDPDVLDCRLTKYGRWDPVEETSLAKSYHYLDGALYSNGISEMEGWLTDG